jgi:hypothetical protein
MQLSRLTDQKLFCHPKLTPAALPYAPAVPPPGADVTDASSWNDGAAVMRCARCDKCSWRLSSSGTSAASTSGGAMLMSSTNSQRPSITAYIKENPLQMSIQC